VYNQKKKRTALMWAAHRGHVSVVLFLIKKGAALEQKDNVSSEENSFFSHLTFAHSSIAKKLHFGLLQVDRRCR
jgi:hypothetical protein